MERLEAQMVEQRGAASVRGGRPIGSSHDRPARQGARVTRSFAFGWCLVAWVGGNGALTACESEPFTEVVVHIDAQAPLLTDATQLEVRVWNHERTSTVFEKTLEMAEVRDQLPLTLSLYPHEGDAARTFLMEVLARNARGEMLAVSRAEGAYLTDQRMSAGVCLRERCRGVSCGSAEACAAGAQCLTCSTNEGRCVSARIALSPSGMALRCPALECSPSASEELDCANGVDDDCDARPDCDDPDCAGRDGCVAPPITYPGRPPEGQVYWGAHTSLDDVEDPARHESVAGRPLGLHRTYWFWSERDRAVAAVTEDLAMGRLPWISIKMPSWLEVAEGVHDPALDPWLMALGDVEGPVWLTINPVPETGAGQIPDDPSGASGHRAMNRHVRSRIEALAIENVALNAVFVAWTFRPGGNDIDDWWEPAAYDFVGVLHRVDDNTSLVTENWSLVRLWAADRGVDLAVSEWGLRGADAAAGNHVREWFEHVAGSGSDGAGARVVGAALLDSDRDGGGTSWQLMGEPLRVFRELLGDPRSARVRQP